MDESPSTAGTQPMHPTWLVTCGRFFFRYRNAVFPLVLLPLALIFKPTYLFGNERFDHWLDVLGILIALSGEGLRSVVIGYAYVKRGGKKKQVYADSLVTEGFFNHCRNPLYVGNLLVILGLVVIHNSPWLYLITIPFFTFAYIAIVATEETFLQEKFGQAFIDYCQRVHRWWIDPRGLRRSLAAMRFNWRRVIVKEYGTMATFGTSLILFLAYEALRHHTYGQRPIYLTILFALLGLIVIGWATARYLKKVRGLTDIPPDEPPQNTQEPSHA